MLKKLALLLRHKLALAAIGVMVIGGGGTAVAMAAAHSGAPANSSPAHVHGDDGDNGHTVGIEGTLKAFDAGAQTITVLSEHATATQTIAVNGDTRVNGEHASSLSDLANAIGHKVEVQSAKQSDGSLLASKITLEGAQEGNDNDDDNDHNEREIRGTLQSVDVGGATFVVLLGDGSTVTVHVSASTEFDGHAHGLGDLAKGETVEVHGAAQSDGSIAASRVQAEDEGTSGDDHGGDGSSSGHGGSGSGD
jgi:hypothetical protein